MIRLSSSLLFGLLLSACSDSSANGPETSVPGAADGGSQREGGAPADASGAPPAASAPEGCADLVARAWSSSEATLLRERVITRFAELKRDNDALIDRRGVGSYVGANTDTWRAMVAGDRATAAAQIGPHVKRGYDVETVLDELQGTSCIGRVYRVLDEVYRELGRRDEWAAIEACGRAHESNGLTVQSALIASGWPAPTLGLVTDAERLPGSADEVAFHQDFLRAASAGSYYGVPVSTARTLQNFLPSPTSDTPLDTSVWDELRRSTFLAFATLRGAYHVPLVVPGRLVPANLAPAGDSSWSAARDASEPFVLESHSYREAWDKTNFEIRPLRQAIGETFSDDVVYATGTVLFAPGSTFAP